MTNIFIGTASAFGRWRKEYNCTGDPIKHVSTRDGLRGLTVTSIFYDRREMGKNAKMQSLLYEAQRGPSGSNHYALDAGKVISGPIWDQPIWDHYGKGGYYRSFAEQQALFFKRQAEKAKRFVDAEKHWLDADAIERILRPGNYANEELNRLFAKESDLTCMWCAHVFPTEEALEEHEAGCR